MIFQWVHEYHQYHHTSSPLIRSSHVVKDVKYQRLDSQRLFIKHTPSLSELMGRIPVYLGCVGLKKYGCHPPPPPIVLLTIWHFSASFSLHFCLFKTAS